MQLSAEKLTKQRWAVLIASCIINLCIGSMYAWSVFSSPMAEFLSTTTGETLTAANLGTIFTVANLFGPLTMIVGGGLTGKIGPKWVIFIGGVLFGLGMIVSGFATSIGMLMVGYGVLCGLGMGFAYGCTISNSVAFFPDKRGLIGGIATASYGLSSVIIPFVANALINSVGITSTFKVIGVAFLVLICGCSFLVKQCPVGFTPAGWTPAAPKGGKKDTAPKAVPADKNWKQMLADPIFYIMLLMLCCGASFGMMAISQASPIAQNMIGMSAGAAATVVAVLALFNAAGRVVCGYISDLLGRVTTLMIMLVMAIVGLGCLYFCGEGMVVLFYVGIALIGLCFGSFMGIYPGFTADQFGAKNNGVNYGIMFIGFAAAGVVGPIIIKNVYSAQGSYQPAFLLAAALAVVGLVLAVVFNIVSKKRRA